MIKREKSYSSDSLIKTDAQNVQKDIIFGLKDLKDRKCRTLASLVPVSGVSFSDPLVLTLFNISPTELLFFHEVRCIKWQRNTLLCRLQLQNNLYVPCTLYLLRIGMYMYKLTSISSKDDNLKFKFVFLLNHDGLQFRVVE